MRIAICDDEIRDLETMVALLAAYQAKTGANLMVGSFTSGDALLETLEKGARFDVLFLDILMPGISGIDTARELHRLGAIGELVFLTISPDFALDAFSVKAKDYLIKPISEERLFALMDELSSRLDENEMIVLRSKNGLRRLLPDRIEYCESIGHTLFWHLRSGAVIESNGTMQSAEELLMPSGQFLRARRSYLINKSCVRVIDKSGHTVELESMVRIPIPRVKFAEIEAQYIQNVKGGKAE